MKNIYGFTLLDKNGYGIERWFNGETQLVTNNSLGRLPGILHNINIAQKVMSFKESYHYCFKIAIKYNLQMTLYNEADWNEIQDPIKKILKKIKFMFGIS